MAITIGCGSWADDEYVGMLYPAGLPPKERLRVYAQWFDRVEVNSSYYATPRRDTVLNWVAQTPRRFQFDLKLHRAFSQNPVAAAQGELLRRFVDAVQPLLEAKKLGAFLLTLSPFFTPDRHQLQELDTLAEKLKPTPLAVELRNRTWVDGDALASTLDYFRTRGLSWVALDMPRLKSPALLPPIDEVTNPRLAYVRLHGRNPRYLKVKGAAERHRHDYSAAELEEIVERIRKLADRARQVHVSVNNHANDFAPKAALALRQLLGQRVRTEPPKVDQVKSTRAPTASRNGAPNAISQLSDSAKAAQASSRRQPRAARREKNGTAPAPAGLPALDRLRRNCRSLRQP